MNKVIERISERVPSSLVVKFDHDNCECYGIVTNLSEEGMCIQSGTCLPCDAKISLQIPLKKGELKLPARVMRVERTNGFYDTMGVQLLRTTKKYMKILDSFRMAAMTA